MANTDMNKAIAKELGSSGGKKTLEKYGKEHYRKLAHKRWDKEKEKKDQKLKVESGDNL